MKKRILSIIFVLVLVSGLGASLTATASSTTPMVNSNWGVALDRNGNVWDWNFDRHPRVPPTHVPNLSNIIDISGVTALRSDGTVWNWFWTWDGVSDNGTIPSEAVQVPGLNNIIAVSWMAALRNDGTVWQVSHGSFHREASATQISGLSNIIALSSSFGLALRNDGTVWHWRDGSEAIPPTQIPNLTNVIAVTGSVDRGAVLRSDGTVHSLSQDWGSERVNVQQIPNLRNITSISDGTALRSDGTVWQFRGGKGWDIFRTPVQMPNLRNIVSIGRDIAVDRDGYVWEWNSVFFEDGIVGAPHRLSGPGGVGFLNLNNPPHPPIAVTLDGSRLAFDVPPQSIDGRTMVPLRAIFEALGAEVNFNDAAQTITGTKDGTTVLLPLGSTTPTVNGQTVTIDVPAVVQNGRTLVPLRFVAESFGVSVEWNTENRVVAITT